MRATICNCMASGLALSKAVANAGVPASAAVSCHVGIQGAAITRAVFGLHQVRLAGGGELALSASLQAVEPNSGACAAQRHRAAGGDLVLHGVLPLMNTALPLTLTQVKVAWPLDDRNRSPMRPPQPEVAPSGNEDCQTDCWSLCENSLGGNGTLRALYCASVVGWIRCPR
jgi:hypothetical protein